jgi:phosphatidylglycerol---prolipoprotein diacylglyceryl transferase
MHPILFQIGPLTLYAYGFLVALGFFVGSLWVNQRAKQVGENVDLYLQAIFWILVAGFAGARLLYVIYYPDLYLEAPLKILLDRGGLVWYGGLFSALTAMVIFTRVKKLEFGKFADILVIPAALGLAVGRVGCFMTGCCYGRITSLPWGVQFPPGHETYPAHVHPAQLYESLALVVLVILLEQVYRRAPRYGVTTCLFFIGYGIIRFLLEYLRGDVIYWVGHVLSASQVFSLLGAGAALVMLLRIRSAKPVNLPHSISPL